MQLVGTVVAVVHGHDAGIALYGEREFLLGRGHATALAVDGKHADVLQVFAVGTPCLGIGNELKSLRGAGGLYAVRGHTMPVLIGHGLQVARLVLNVIKLYLVPCLGVGGVFLFAHLLAIAP